MVAIQQHPEQVRITTTITPNVDPTQVTKVIELGNNQYYYHMGYGKHPIHEKEIYFDT